MNSLKPPYFKIEGTALTRTNEYKYLGVTITSDLTWKPHITNICNKTRKLIGLFYRRFYNNCSSQTLLQLYLSYIRPHLEYSSAVWNPHLKGEIADIERVQKFALRVCLKSWDPLTSYNDLLTAAKLPTLQSRRDQSSICHLFKIVNGLTDFPNAPIKQCEFHYNSRSANSAALSIPYFHTSSHQNSFSLLLLLNGTTYLLIMSYPSVTQLIHLSITYQNMFLNLCGWYVLYSQLANSML